MEPESTHRPAELLGHLAWLRKLARHLVSDPHTADDVVQTTLVASLGGPRVPREGMHAWLAGVARNVARQVSRTDGRRARRERRAARPESLPSAEDVAALVETQQMLSNAVLNLAEPYRTAVFLRYFEGLTPAQIAERLDVPASTVRVRLKRALEILRQHLDRAFGGDTRAWGAALLPMIAPTRSEPLTTSAGPVVPLLSGKIAMSIQLKFALAATVAVGASALLWNHRTQAPIVGEAQSVRIDAALLSSAGPSMTRSPSRDGRTSFASAPADIPDAFADVPSDQCCIVGRIIDELGRPVAGAGVEAVDGQPRDARILVPLEEERDPRLAVADERGRYRLEALPRQPFLLRVTHPGFAPGVTSSVFAGETRDVILERGATLAVTVVAQGSGQGIVGAEVGVDRIHASGRSAAWSISATTDDSGSATLMHIPRGDFRAFAKLPGFGSERWRSAVEESLELEHEFRLAPEAVVSGVVVDAATGDPLPGADVVSGDWSGRTDRKGRFRIGRLSGSEQFLRPVVASAPGFGPDIVYVASRVAGETTEIALRLGAGARVAGRVVDALAVPVAGASVVFRGRFSTNPFTAEWHTGRVTTDGYGRFELSSLHPSGKYSLAARARGEHNDLRVRGRGAATRSGRPGSCAWRLGFRCARGPSSGGRGFPCRDGDVSERPFPSAGRVDARHLAGHVPPRTSGTRHL